MNKSAGHGTKERGVTGAGEVRVRRAYFECRFGQLNVRTAFPESGGFDERTTLLCLHSEPGSSRMFARLLPEIARDRSVFNDWLQRHVLRTRDHAGFMGSLLEVA